LSVHPIIGFKMLTVIFLWAIAVAWLISNGLYAEKRSSLHRRQRTAWSAAFIGGCAGSLAGLLASRLSLPGAIVASVAACLIARALLPR